MGSQGEEDTGMSVHGIRADLSDALRCCLCHRCLFVYSAYRPLPCTLGAALIDDTRALLPAMHQLK